jgi:hypothetical protein
LLIPGLGDVAQKINFLSRFSGFLAPPTTSPLCKEFATLFPTMPRLTERQADIHACEEVIEYYDMMSEAGEIDDEESELELELDLDLWMAQEEIRQEEEMLRMEIDMELELISEDIRIEDALIGNQIEMEAGAQWILDSDSGDAHDSPRTFARRKLEEIQSQRYRFRNPYRTNEERHLWYEDAMKEDGRTLRSMFRMDPDSLDRVITTLGTHSVYQSRGTKPQKPAALQIGIALYYFGGDCSKHRIAKVFGISSGSVHNYVDRFITAVLSLQDQYLHWPEPHSDEYKRVVQMHLVGYGFPDCLGFVDGTQIPIWRKPDGAKGGNYFNHKKVYAINLTIIVDAETRILFAVTGREIPRDVNANLFRHFLNSRQCSSQRIRLLSEA